MARGKENNGGASIERPSKRAPRSPFGAAHDELVALLAKVGVDAPTADNTDGAPARFRMASALECRMATQRLMFDDEAKVAMVDGLKALWDSSEQWLRLCLAPTVAADGGSGDSVIKVLLRVDALQPELVETLLEHVVTLSADGFETDSVLADSTPRLVLAHLRWLDAAVDSAALVNKLLQVLPLCPPALQRELIALVPEVAEDGQQELVIDTFQELMLQDSTFTVPVLHALGGLELPPELAGRVLDMLVGALPSASAADLPALARALLQSAPRASVSRAVTELRKHVHVEAVQVGSAADTAHEPQLLDALASSVQFRREVASAVLAELGAADALTSLDVWLLCALHSGSSTSSARKLTERTFVRKAADGALSARVARDAVRGHSVALRAHHRALLSFAAAAVRAAQHSLARELGCALYAAAFTELGAAGADGAVSPSGGGGLAFYRQELIGSLLSHGGSGVQSEVDCALSVLWALVEADAAPLKPHSALLSTQLDHLDVLTLAQTRQLFAIFGRLALEADGVSRGRRGDELSILVRKMLTAVDPAFKKRGIAAACAIIEQLCPAQPPNGAGQSATCSAAGSAAGEAISAAAASEAAIEAESLLEQMAITCARDWRCAAFCNAEFSRAVCAGRLHQSLVQKLQAQSHDRLEKAHIVEQSTLDIDNMVAYHGVRSAIVLSLESDDTELAVDISYTLIKARNAPAGAGAGAGSGVAGGVGVGSFGGVHLLCSTVELLAECMTRVDGSLSEMDAVLGCPLLLFEAADVLPASTKLRGMSDEARELTCACLFHAANWIRCLLYCFSREVVRANDTSAAANLVSRLESLAAIELVLEQCAGVTPSFVGALAFTHGLAQPAGAGKKAGGASKAAKGKAAKPKKADDEDEDMLDATGTAQDGGAAGPSKPAGGKGGGKGGKKGGGKRSAAGEGDDGKAPAAKKKKAAAAPKAAKPAASGPAAAAKAAASLGLPTGSLHDWPTLPVCAQLSPLFRPISLQTSVLLALVSSKDCNTNDETIEVDPGETVKVSELSPAALHLLVASMHARLAPLLHAAGGGGSLGRVGFGAGGGGAGGALVGAEDSDAAAAAERNLGIDEAFSQVVLGLCSLPQHMSMLLEVIDSTHARAPNAKERAPMDEDEDEDEGGVAPRERDEPPASAKVFERVDERLQPSYALPCVSTTLRLLRAIFACTRLRHVDSPSRAHIASLLHAFSAEGAPRPSRHPPDVELAHLAKNAFDYFEALLPSIPCGTTSLDVIELLLAIAQVPANAAAQQRKSLVRRASDAAEVVLGRAWASHMPKPRGSQVGRLFSISLAHAADPKGVLDDWVRLVLPPFLAQVTDQCDGEGYAAQQPLLSTKTIHLFYKPLAEQLVVLLRALDLPSDPAAVKQLDGAEVEAKVASVMEVIGLFSGLLSPSKRLETNGLFIAHILRMSRQFLEVFNKHAMAFFIATFSLVAQREAIASALKAMQVSTRLIQSLCAQSKALRTVGALSQLPHVKKQLELFVFNVKQMLAEHECGAAFWMGNLKHKTAAGKTVSSQVEPLAALAKAKAASRQPSKPKAKRNVEVLEEEEENAVDLDDAEPGSSEEGEEEEEEEDGEEAEEDDGEEEEEESGSED